MALPTRKIGADPVSAVGYGASAGHGRNELTEEDRLKFLDETYSKDCKFWDTSDIYPDIEELFGKWFKKSGKRGEIFLATKFGFGPVVGRSRMLKGNPDYVEEAFNKSINRLDVESVDLYYLHRADPTVPIELTVRAMAKLVKDGKVKYLGLCECSVDTLRRAHAVHPIAAVQVEYSPLTTDIEDEKVGLLKACRELGVAVVAFSPLGKGVLTGRYKSADDFNTAGDWRKFIPRFSRENFPNILTAVEGLKKLGERHNATAGQVALAWLLAQGEDVIPLFGSWKLENLEENLGSLDVKLSSEEEKEVRKIVEKSAAALPSRFPPGLKELAYGITPALSTE